MDCQGEKCLYQLVKKHNSIITIAYRTLEGSQCSDIVECIIDSGFIFYFAIVRASGEKTLVCVAHCRICHEHVSSEFLDCDLPPEDMRIYTDMFDNEQALLHYINHWESLGTYEKVEAYVEAYKLSQEDVDNGLVIDWHPNDKKRKKLK